MSKLDYENLSLSKNKMFVQIKYLYTIKSNTILFISNNFDF